MDDRPVAGTLPRTPLRAQLLFLLPQLDLAEYPTELNCQYRLIKPVIC